MCTQKVYAYTDCPHKVPYERDMHRPPRRDIVIVKQFLRRGKCPRCQREQEAAGMAAAAAKFERPSGPTPGQSTKK